MVHRNKNSMGWNSLCYHSSQSISNFDCIASIIKLIVYQGNFVDYLLCKASAIFASNFNKALNQIAIFNLLHHIGYLD